ncbi:MAG: LEPR-XLL domain-containing protein, partial [Candidatus Brocadiae bacterium]|nr:LEPR-XLL domain-containing protein [Candidatus Brocadiia bacterium]
MEPGHPPHADGQSERLTLRLEPLEPRIMLSTVEWLPGLVGPDDVVEHTQGQVIYLDFDGAEDVSYNGPVTVEDIEAPAFAAEPLAIVRPVGVTTSDRGVVEVVLQAEAMPDTGTILIDASDVVPLGSGTISGSNGTNYPIEDYTTAWSQINISGAPPGAQATSVTASWNIDHDYVWD